MNDNLNKLMSILDEFITLLVLYKDNIVRT